MLRRSQALWSLCSLFRRNVSLSKPAPGCSPDSCRDLPGVLPPRRSIDTCRTSPDQACHPPPCAPLKGANDGGRYSQKSGGKSGWLSTNQSNKGFSIAYKTLPRNQVVCKGFNPARGDIAIRPPGRRPFRRRPTAGLLGLRAEAYSYPTTTCGERSPRSGMDSDLEAFSHNPADGSVAALPGRTAANTNYPNQRFLSY